MEFTDKLNEGMATIAGTFRSGVGNARTEGKILEQKKRIKNLTREIGKLAVVKLDEGEEMTPAIMERYAAIIEARSEIEVLEKGRELTSEPVCPNCGEKITEGMRYCGNCNADLSAAREESAAEESSEEEAKSDDEAQ
jgi:hypothetical protein